MLLLFFRFISVCIFWTALYKSHKMSFICGWLVLIISIFSTLSFLIYFFRYIYFEANSLLDSILFWTSNDQWVDHKELPFTFWHLLTILYVIVNSLGFYYSFMLYKAAKIFKAEKQGIDLDFIQWIQLIHMYMYT